MKHPPRPKAPARALRRRTVAARVAPAVAAPADPAGEPERPSIEAAQQPGRDDDPRRAPSDIERALEHRLDALQTAPLAGRDAGVAGFVEPASEDHGDGPRAEPVEDG